MDFEAGLAAKFRPGRAPDHRPKPRRKHGPDPPTSARVPADLMPRTRDIALSPSPRRTRATVHGVVVCVLPNGALIGAIVGRLAAPRQHPSHRWIPREAPRGNRDHPPRTPASPPSRRPKRRSGRRRFCKQWRRRRWWRRRRRRRWRRCRQRSSCGDNRPEPRRQPQGRRSGGRGAPGLSRRHRVRPHHRRAQGDGRHKALPPQPLPAVEGRGLPQPAPHRGGEGQSSGEPLRARPHPGAPRRDLQKPAPHPGGQGPSSGVSLRARPHQRHPRRDLQKSASHRSGEDPGCGQPLPQLRPQQQAAGPRQQGRHQHRRHTGQHLQAQGRRLDGRRVGRRLRRHHHEEQVGAGVRFLRGHGRRHPCGGQGQLRGRHVGRGLRSRLVVGRPRRQPGEHEHRHERVVFGQLQPRVDPQSQRRAGCQGHGRERLDACARRRVDGRRGNGWTGDRCGRAVGWRNVGHGLGELSRCRPPHLCDGDGHLWRGRRRCLLGPDGDGRVGQRRLSRSQLGGRRRSRRKRNRRTQLGGLGRFGFERNRRTQLGGFGRFGFAWNRRTQLGGLGRLGFERYWRTQLGRLGWVWSWRCRRRLGCSPAVQRKWRRWRFGWWAWRWRWRSWWTWR